MDLYSERHGLRKPIEKTYEINRAVYLILLDSCKQYEKNLTHLFKKEVHHDFTNSDYITFDTEGFKDRVKLKIPNLFTEKSNKYDLLDYIEYFAQNIKDISEQWNNSRYKNYKYIKCFETTNIFDMFQKMINEIFMDAGLLYILTDDKKIERIVENDILTSEIEEDIKNIEETGTRELLEEAIELYKDPHSSRYLASEKLWDAFERVKTINASSQKQKNTSADNIIEDMANLKQEYIDLFKEEFKNLTYIGNNFRIRHHETYQIDITDDRHYDYFFNRCLSLIALAIQYINE